MLKKAIDTARRIAGSLPFSLFLFLLASYFWCMKTDFYYQGNIYGILTFVGIISFLLILCDDTAVTLLPFLLTCMLAVRCYNSFDRFIVYAPWAAIPVAALIFHFVAYRKPLRYGSSLFGILAVTVAITLGGLFTIPAEQYFSGTSLFYIFGLGAGMVAAYFLTRSRYQPREGYDVAERLLSVFYLAALFSFVMLGQYILTSLDSVKTWGISVQWSNNLATMLMFFLPAPFYYAVKKNRLHLIMAFLVYFAILLTGSRGGFLMGTVEFALCFIYLARYDRPCRVILLSTVAAVLISVAVTVKAWLPLAESFITTDEPRFRLMIRAFEDFARNPVFGMGIGYQGNSDIYNPVKGAANWYHMMPFQIIGGFGLVGVAAYGYQFFGRMKLIFRKPTPKRLALGLSYSGVLLMSMVNPGEFCPVPYQFLAVLLFILLENTEEGDQDNAFLPLWNRA